MRITYRVQLEDLVEFSQFHADRSTLLSQQRRRSLIIVPAILIALGLLLWLLIGSVTYLVTHAICAAAWAFLWPRFNRRIVRDRVAKLYREGDNKAVLGLQTLVADDDGLHSISHTGDESKRMWSSIEKVEMGDRHLFIYLSAVTALVVPKETVDEGDIDEFAATCLARIG